MVAARSPSFIVLPMTDGSLLSDVVQKRYVNTTAPAAFHAVQDALKARGFAPESAELAMVPKNTVKVEGADAERILRLVEVLEELDDVSKVFSNFDIDAAQLAEAET
jgi:transcriptional/translational regulatory protein YebC/TACO1